jgi:hypothetical protein
MTIIKLTQGNLKKTEIHVLYNAVQTITNGMQVTYFNKICEKLHGLHKNFIYGLKKNKLYCESIGLKIATPRRFQQNLYNVQWYTDDELIYIPK